MDPLTIGLGLVAVVLVAGVWHLLSKSRRLAGDHVFVASRLSRGNRLFPVQVKITPTTVVRYTPQWFGQLEQSINIAHVASVKVDTDLLFANVCIETTGGQRFWLDEEGIKGRTQILWALSDTKAVATQGPVWYVGGRAI